MVSSLPSEGNSLDFSGFGSNIFGQEHPNLTGNCPTEPCQTIQSLVILYIIQILDMAVQFTQTR